MLQVINFANLHIYTEYSLIIPLKPEVKLLHTAKLSRKAATYWKKDIMK
jgi:hypothetical protein